MSTRPRIFLLNPNSNATSTSEMTRIAQAALPHCDVIGCTAPFGPTMITEPSALQASVAAVIQMGQRILKEEQLLDGVIVAAFGDPGLAEVRGALQCPVCGIGEASFLEAAAGGRRFAVATTTPGLIESIAKRAAAVVSEQGLFLGTYVPSSASDPVQLLQDPMLMTEHLRITVQALQA